MRFRYFNAKIIVLIYIIKTAALKSGLFPLLGHDKISHGTAEKPVRLRYRRRTGFSAVPWLILSCPSKGKRPLLSAAVLIIYISTIIFALKYLNLMRVRIP